MKKVTWKNIFKDFKKRYPHLSKEVTYWCPKSYATILLYIKDGSFVSYNYDTKTASMIEGSWIYDHKK